MEFRTAAAILPVKDVAASLARYAQLGFDGVLYNETTPEGQPFYGFLKRDGIDLHLTLVPHLDPASNTSAVYLYVDDRH